MPIKAIVCDMDGTLLTAGHAISPKTQELLLITAAKRHHAGIGQRKKLLAFDAGCPETEDGFLSRLFD
jgi:hydroxymethylpyrimidine pyrophosphatase-like HAD family hydrolase